MIKKRKLETSLKIAMIVILKMFSNVIKVKHIIYFKVLTTFCLFKNINFAFQMK